MSAPLTPAPWTRTRTSPFPGSGSGRSATAISPSGIVAARMGAEASGAGRLRAARTHPLAPPAARRPGAARRERGHGLLAGPAAADRVDHAGGVGTARRANRGLGRVEVVRGP